MYTRDQNAFTGSPRAVLNVSRDSMARYGLSPATRVFEAALAPHTYAHRAVRVGALLGARAAA